MMTETCREAFERIALPNFGPAPAQATIDDHWQTWQEAWQAAVSAERERCAKLCEGLQQNKSPDYFPGQAFDGACRTCADAIRGETPADPLLMRGLQNLHETSG